MRVGNTDVYKIGYSKHPKKRLKTIQTNNYELITLIACCPGGRSVEEHFHSKYFSENIRLEWFRLNNKQITLIINEFIKIRLEGEENKEDFSKTFQDNMDYDNCIVNFNKEYKCSIFTENRAKIKKVVEYIKRKSYFIKSNRENFTISSYKLKCFLSNKKLINIYDSNSNIICILSCYVLGCKIYNIHKGYESICSIGLIIKP